MNHFWADLALHFAQPPEKRGPFLTQSYTECVKSGRESFLVQCFLDLSFKTSHEHKFVQDDANGVTIKAACNLILYKKQIVESQIDLKEDLMVIHRYSQLDRNGTVDEDLDEFITDKMTKCEIVITNVSPNSYSFNLLYQIPQGSMTMKQSKEIQSKYLSLQPYSTHRSEFHFYFPSEGEYTHHPSNVSIDSVITAKSESKVIQVVKKKKITVITSFDDVLAAGTKGDVLHFLKTKDLINGEQNFSFSKIYHLLQADEGFFTTVIGILKKRRIFDAEVWCFSFCHKSDVKLMRETIKALRDREDVKDKLDLLGYYF